MGFVLTVYMLLLTLSLIMFMLTSSKYIRKNLYLLQIATSPSDIALDKRLARMRFRSANYSEKEWARWALCCVTCTCCETAVHENLAEVKTSSFHCWVHLCNLWYIHIKAIFDTPKRCPLSVTCSWLPADKPLVASAENIFSHFYCTNEVWEKKKPLLRSNSHLIAYLDVEFWQDMGESSV